MPDGADQVFVHGVVVIHVELHHCHDAAECRNETTENARLVHHAQHDVWILACREQFEENGVGLRIVQNIAYEAQRLAQQLQRIGVDLCTVAARNREQADDVDRILGEDIRRTGHHASAIDPKVRRIAQRT